MKINNLHYTSRIMLRAIIFMLILCVPFLFTDNPKPYIFGLLVESNTQAKTMTAAYTVFARKSADTRSMFAMIRRDNSTSVQPVKKFNLFHSLSPCRISTNFIFTSYKKNQSCTRLRDERKVQAAHDFTLS